MYDFNTLTGALAYPGETLIDSGMDDWYDDKKLKGAVKVASGCIIDTALYTAFLIGIYMLSATAALTIESKFHK